MTASPTQPGASTAMQLRAGLWLLLALAVTLVCTAQFAAAGRVPLQTNLLALLPPTERNPLAEEAVRRLADAAGDRAVFLVGAAEPAAAAAAARAFAATLRGSDAFRQVIADIPAFDPGQLTALYVQHRFSLLAAADRAALASGAVGPADLEARLQRKLYTPFRFGLTLPPSDDPFGFSDAWLAELPLRSLRLETENGLLVNHDQRRTWVVITATLSASAYDSTLQQGVAAAVAQAESALRHAHPDAVLLRAGTVFYADAARRSAEREFDLIAAGSLLGMFSLLYLVFRSLRPLALGLLAVAFGIARRSP
jgi:predicted exporter